MSAAAAAPRPFSLPRFVGIVLAWLPACFAVWYIAAPIFVWPAWLAVEGACRAFFADVFRGVTQAGSTFVFATTLKPGTTTAGGTVSVEVNALLYAFGLPLYAALALAAGEPRRLRTLAVGYLLLLPVVAFGVLADALKNVAITAAPQIASQAGFSPLQREVIAFAFQFGSLVLPAVVPAVVWVLTHRAFLERVRGHFGAAAGAARGPR